MPGEGPPAPPVLDGAGLVGAVLDGAGLALDEPLPAGDDELLVAEGGGADDAAGVLLATVLPELSPPQPDKLSGTRASALIASGFRKLWDDMVDTVVRGPPQRQKVAGGDRRKE